MARTVLLLRPTKELIAAAKIAVDRFQHVSGTELSVYRQNINQAADAFEGGRIDIVFTSTLMERAEANFFIGCIENTKNLPLIIASTDNYEMLQGNMPHDRLCQAKNDFSAEFIFACLRNLLSPNGLRLDSRFLVSIEKSVMDVIYKNTELRLEPGPTSEVKPGATTESIIAVIAFYGDGVYGSLSVVTTQAAIVRMGERLLSLSAAEMSRTIAMDMLAEIAHQIMGVLRAELREFGWTLQTSLQMVHCGSPFMNMDTAPGTSFKLPFKLDQEKFDIVLRYSTYQASVEEIEINQDNHSVNKCDVRLLNLSTEVCQAMLSSVFAIEARKQNLNACHAEPHATESIYVFHAGGCQGEYTIALEMNRELAQTLAKRVKNPHRDAPDELTQHMHIFGKIVQSMGLEFNRQCRPFGYNFAPIYSSMSMSNKSFQHMLRSPGYTVRTSFLIGTSRFELYFALRSDYAPALFDAWPLVEGFPRALKESIP